MKTHLKILVALYLSVGLISLTGCIDDSDDVMDKQPASGGTPVVGTCSFAGETYQIGERFEAGDGCNRCSCEDGGAVACTEIGCTTPMEPCTPAECGAAPGAARQLCPDGINYEGPGECTRAPDGICGYPVLTCPSPMPSSSECTPEECGPAPGAPQFLCPDGENYGGPGPCRRLEDGTCGYPNQVCPPGPPQMNNPCDEVLCETGSECRDGECVFTCQPGESYPAGDGCNTCTCPESGNAQEASCTDDACGSECSQDADCENDDYCDFAGDSCGLLGRKGTCQPRVTECPEPGGVPTCGCDGTLALSACALANRGTDVSAFGGCEVDQPDTFACGRQTCDADTDMCSVTGNDVVGPGQSDFFFSCVALPEMCEPGDCDCAGGARCTIIGGNTFTFTPGG